MPFSEFRRRSLRDILVALYGEQGDAVLDRLERLCDRDLPVPAAKAKELWSERDVVLITYGDMVQSDKATPLESLRAFLLDNELDGVLNTVHLLPFFPYSSDDGFSVVDYRAVDPALGDWSDVRRLGESFGLMFDLVLNHCSQHSRWFQGYLQGEEPYARYFIEADPGEPGLSRVTRPRSLPLLTAFPTPRGERHVWTTFSEDQIDLNFAAPDVLLEFVEILLFYVRQGARIVRLDAIAYLWKRVGTNCIHLPETHLVVKLLRALLDELAPGTILLTETNVPHAENVGYFGDGDEARMVYQFSLAPLLLDAFATRDPTPLNEWLRSLAPTSAGASYFNFTASHDGIGVRPLEGLVGPARLDRLVEAVLDRGGQVSTKRNPDGTDSPYELNTTYFSALADRPAHAEANALPSPRDDRHARRFLASQAVMLALRGVPGVYFHSLVGTPNWTEGVAQSGRARSINRRKFRRDELDAILDDARSPQARVFDGYRRMLAIRIAQPAFHPEANQSAPAIDSPGIIGFVRTSLDGSQRILVLCNVTDAPVTPELSGVEGGAAGFDLLTGARFDGAPTIAPDQTVWLQLD